MNKIKAVCLEEPNKVGIIEIDMPIKKENEVLIKMESFGICGSDVGAFLGHNPLVSYPRIIGHELCGTVIKGGLGMPSNVKVGDRVIVDPYVWCGHCYPCSIGRTNCCESLKVLGVHIDGGMSEYLTHRADLITKCPDNIPLHVLPMSEPLTISLHALHRCEVKAGEHIAIIGAGAIGILAAQAAIAYDAIPILIDIVEERLELSRSIGIKHTLNPLSCNVVAELKKITNNRLCEVVIEASGANVSVQNSLSYASHAGRVALTGWPKKPTELLTSQITFKELDIRGARTSKNEFKEALELLSLGKISYDSIITKVVSFDDLPEALINLSNDPSSDLKIVGRM